MNGWLSDYKAYAYHGPVPKGHPADGGAPRFDHMRAKVNGDPNRTKTFFYKTRKPEQPWNYMAALIGHPSRYGIEYRDCLYQWFLLRRSLAALVEVILWCEGEKDADNARRAYGTPATSHHGGAEKAYYQQAELFAPLVTRAGRRAGTRVLLLADRDDPGYACAAGRKDLLEAVGLRRNQIEVVRAADGVLAGGGGCPADRPCHCPRPCPVPSKRWRGADLSDHVAAGLGLRDLTRVTGGELEAGQARWAAKRREGARYCGGGAA